MVNAASLAPSPADSGTDYTLSGELDIATASQLWPKARRLPDATRIDAHNVTRCDGAGAALLFDLARRGIQINGLDPALQQLIDALEPDKPLASAQPNPSQPLIARLGQLTHAWIADLIEQVTYFHCRRSER